MNRQEFNKVIVEFEKNSIGSDWATTDAEQDRMTSEAKDLLIESGADPNQLNDKIVFYMHQGYFFRCVSIHKLFGPVFSYQELDKELKWEAGTLKEIGTLEE